MKLILTIIFSLFLSKSCKDTNKTTKTDTTNTAIENVVADKENMKNNNLKDVKIWYQANTRGFYFQFTVENGKANAVYQRSSEPIEVNLSADDLIKLSTLYSNIDLEKLIKLKGSTQMRFTDGKAYANLHIFKNGKEYYTEGFDHGIPPTEIKEICDLMCQLGKKKE